MHYNIFMKTNILADQTESLSDYFRLLGQPVRLKILLILAGGEACVCHMEAILGLRQAIISQHIMLLRKKGIIVSRRDGRHIYYQVKNINLIESVLQIANVLNISIPLNDVYTRQAIPECPCPRCNPGLEPALICKKPLIKTNG